MNSGNNNVLVAKNLTAGTNQYYLYGLEQISQGGTASSSRQYPITDGQGTVRYLTNNSGTTVTNGTFAYDPYGKQTSGSATLSNYMFQSEQKDSESGLTYLRARSYDPTIGRFTSKDPLSGVLSDSTTQNGYNYANNDPINMSDPLGLAAACGGRNQATPPNVKSYITIVPPKTSPYQSIGPVARENFNYYNAGGSALAWSGAGGTVGTYVGCGVGAILTVETFGAGCVPGSLIGRNVGTVVGGAIGFLLGGNNKPASGWFDPLPNELYTPKF